MPTIGQWNGFRVHFYSKEGNEPPHVHIVKAERECKIWLSSVRLAYNYGMKNSELTRLIRLVEQKRGEYLERWHAYFGQEGGA